MDTTKHLPVEVTIEEKPADAVQASAWVRLWQRVLDEPEEGKRNDDAQV